MANKSPIHYHFREFMPTNCPKHKDIQLLVIADKETELTELGFVIRS